MMSDAASAQKAQELLRAGHCAEAIAVVENAARKGDAEALFLLATWYLGAYPLSRDVGHALELLCQAAEIGHVDAALMQVALIANGAIASPDWTRAHSLLVKAAVADPMAAKQFKLVSCMAVDQNGYPARSFKPVRLSTRNPIWTFPNFLTAEECHYLANKAAPQLSRSQIADPLDGALKPHPVRSSLDAVIGPAQEDLVIGAINRRIAVISKTEFDHGEPLTILCYPPGGQYRPHLDALPTEKNIRIRTVLVYLNDNFDGGETHFPNLNIRITPRAGMAVMFDNHDAVGTPDPSSAHAGMPVRKGTKWVASRWIRKYPLDLWACG